jgi:hypothetical protein
MLHSSILNIQSAHIDVTAGLNVRTDTDVLGATIHAASV